MHKKLNNFFALILQLRLVVSILLNRELLSTWYPGFLNTTLLELQFRQISSISSDTFTNLTNLNMLNEKIINPPEILSLIEENYPFIDT